MSRKRESKEFGVNLPLQLGHHQEHFVDYCKSESLYFVVLAAVKV